MTRTKSSTAICLWLAAAVSAQAADMTGADISKLISGNTLYMEFVAAT